ncbi:hypothetical protein ACSLMO_03060 [Flavobacterium columnare]
MHATGINAIYGVAISKLLLKKKIYLLSRLYKSSTYHASFYSLIFIGIILIYLPLIKNTLDPQNQFLNIETIIWILCLGAFSNVATGFNSEIIAYSKYFKFNLLIVALLLLLNLSMVVYFLKFTQLGLLGVAISSTISIVLYNIFKTYYVYIKYNILPFSKSYLQIICLNIVLFIGILNISYQKQTPFITFLILLVYLALNIIFYRVFKNNHLKYKVIK